MDKTINKVEKLADLHKQRDEAIVKLENYYKNFRGVHHEDSASEIKYMQIKVMESFVESLNTEIKQLESSNDQTNFN
jgi:flagellar biosynthesis chaperone FliJ